MTESKPLLYLLITEEQDKSYGGGYYHLRGRLVTERDENGRRVPYGLRDSHKGWRLNDLTINSQGDSGTRQNERQPLYGFDVEYRQPFSVGLNDAQQMFKTLTHVHKGLAKLQEARGYVQTFGEYCGRVAEVLKCDGICIDSPERLERMGDRWQWHTLGDGINAINHRVWKWTQAGTEQCA